MPKLSDLLTSAAAVRNESAAEQNTALRVGNVLYSLTQYLQQYTSVADISMKVSAVGVTITAKSQTGDTTLFDKTIALPVASSEQAGIMTAEAFAAFQSDISELQENLTALFNEKEVLADRVKVNSENIADLGLALRGKSANSSAYYDPFISMGDIKGWPAFTDKLDGISDISELENKQKYMGRCRARVDGITVEVYHFINSFSNNDLSQVVLGNVSAIKDEQGKWQVKFTPNKFNIIHRQHKGGEWTDWQRINEQPLATSYLDGLMSADDKKALDSVDSAFKNLEGMNFNEASEYCATFDNIIEKLDGGAIRFSKPTIFTFSGAGSNQGMIINSPSSGGLITQFAFLKASTNGGFSRRIIQYNPRNFTITNVGEWLPISSLIPAATTSAAGLMPAADKAKIDNYPSTPQEIPTATEADPGLMSAEDKTKLNQTKPVEEVTWTSLSHMNAYTECGEFHIKGERTNAEDGLPILNVDPGHTIDATLTVLDSSLTTEGAKNDVCVTQILRMSNRTGGDGHIFIRTGQATTKSQLASAYSTYWGPWEKLMGIFEKNNVTNIEDLDGYTTSGMYSGLFQFDGMSEISGGVEMFTGSTFLIVTINGYKAAKAGLTPQLTQMLYLLPAKDFNAPTKMYMRTAYWDVNVEPKKWKFANWDNNNSVVRCTAQEFSEDEKNIARENIGASKKRIIDTYTEQEQTATMQGSYKKTDLGEVIPKGSIITSISGDVSSFYTYNENLTLDTSILIKSDVLPYTLLNDCYGVASNPSGNLIISYSKLIPKELNEYLEGEVLEIKEDISNIKKEFSSINISNILFKNKKIAVFGDSITHMTGSDGKSYSDWIAEYTGAEVVNFGIGGATIRQRTTPSLDPASAAQENPPRNVFNVAFSSLDVVNMVKAFVTGDTSYQEAAKQWANNNPSAEGTSTIIGQIDSIDRLIASDIKDFDAIIIMAGTNDFLNTGTTFIDEPTGNLGYTGEAIKEIIKDIKSYSNKEIAIYWFTPIVRFCDPYPFDIYTNYQEGDRVTYNNKRYEFNTEHPAGIWIGTDVTEVTVEESHDIKGWGSNFKNRNKITLEEFSNRLFNLVKSQNIDICDMYHDLGWTFWNFKRFCLPTDRTHPYYGLQYIGRKISSWIISHKTVL